MKLIKTTILSGFSTAIKILISLVTMKIIAHYTGPSGVGIIGQFTTVVGLMGTIGGGGISIGVIKYVAEYASNERSLKDFLGTAFLYAILFSVAALILGILLRRSLSSWIFASPKYAYLIVWLSIAQVFIAFNLFIASVVNGFKRIKLLVSLSIIASCFTLFFIGLLTFHYKLSGALFAVIIAQSTMALVSLAFVAKDKWLPYLFSFKAKFIYVRKLFSYSVMNNFSALVLPLAQIAIRNNVSKILGWHNVGYWQAVLKLSDSYLLVITTALTAYFLPRISELTSMKEIKREVWHTYRFIIPVLVLSMLLIYLLRDPILLIVYNRSFLPARNLFAFQFLGDVFRIGGWVITYVLLAKSWVKTYICTELLISVVLMALCYIMALKYGIIGVTYGFATAYFIYFLVMFGVYLLFLHKSKQQCPQQ